MNSYLLYSSGVRTVVVRFEPVPGLVFVKTKTFVETDGYCRAGLLYHVWVTLAPEYVREFLVVEDEALVIAN